MIFVQLKELGMIKEISERVPRLLIFLYEIAN